MTIEVPNLTVNVPLEALYLAGALLYLFVGLLCGRAVYRDEVNKNGEGKALCWGFIFWLFWLPLIGLAIVVVCLFGVGWLVTRPLEWALKVGNSGGQNASS